MGLTYTRGEIRTLVQDIIRDSSDGLHSAAKKNRIINRVHRDFVERTECNLNVLIFSLADADSDGVIEFDRNEHAPDITLVDVEGRNHYTIDNCLLIDKLSRWDDDDYGWKQLAPKSQFEADQEGLMQVTERPCGYMMLDVPDTFQFLPELGSGGYTYKFEVRYREGIRDLITYDGSPADSTVVRTSGAGLNDFTAAVTNASIPSKYKLIVTTQADPDKVDVYKDILDGNGWVLVEADVVLTGAAQAIADNVTYTAAAATGHTSGDVFEFAVDDLLVPSCPSQFRHAIVNGVVAELLRIERDAEWQGYLAQYEQSIERVKRRVRRFKSDQGSRTRNTYSGAGG